MSAIFAYDGVESKTISSYLGQMIKSLTWICVHEREVIIKSMKLNGFQSIPIKKHATGFFIWQLLTLLSGSARSRYYKPDFIKYLTRLTDETFAEYSNEERTSWAIINLLK